MARKSNYHRSFIILKPKSRGFEFVPNKAPTGYCKFEIRRGVGRAYIYMQDIKPSSSLDGNYEAYLISADDSIRPCKLAGLYTDEQGRCEHIVSFDADDIKGSGYTLENFHALVIAFRTGREGMTIAYPLIGYAGKDIYISTKNITEGLKVIHGDGLEFLSEPEVDDDPKEILAEEKQESTTVAEPEIKDKPERADESEVEDIAEVAYETEVESPAQLEDEVSKEEEPAIESVPEVEDESMMEDGEAEIESETDTEEKPVTEDETGTEIPPEIKFEPLTIYPNKPSEPSTAPVQEETGRSEEELRRAYEDSYQEYLQDFTNRDSTYPYYGPTYWDNVKDYFTGLFNVHQRVAPFDGELKNIEWIRVQQALTGYGGYYTESSYGYPSYSYPDHHIVGLAKKEGQVQYVVYGIPSMYSMIPPISINGFSRWVPIKEGYGMGYWLLYIDAISGRIVYP
ncbi:MAG: hypothetical protein GX340_03280 [Clostridiales bacterium]|nr:hypothetical protein [Clostridiales bacterium]